MYEEKDEIMMRLISTDIIFSTINNPKNEMIISNGANIWMLIIQETGEVNFFRLILKFQFF